MNRCPFYYFSNKILQNFSTDITKLHVCLCFQLSSAFSIESVCAWLPGWED